MIGGNPQEVVSESLPNSHLEAIIPTWIGPNWSLQDCLIFSPISIPEIQAGNKVLKHCGLTDNNYLVLFTPSYLDAMKLVGESYPFFKGNFYLTIIREEEDCIREYVTFKESKVISAPETWLDLRIKGSLLSHDFRRKCKHSPKGL